MGTDSAVFRTLGTKTAMRTDQYNSRWLNGNRPHWSVHHTRIFGPACAALPVLPFLKRNPNRDLNIQLKRKGSVVCMCLETPPHPPRNDKQEMLAVYKRFSPDVSRSAFHILPPLLPTDPSFIHVHLIPDSAERNDDKLYFFFREKSSEMGQSPVTQSRIGRICLVCTHWETCLSCGVNTTKKKARGNMKNDLKAPKAGHPPRLNVCGRRATIWPTLTCRNPHVSLTFLSTMHPSVCEGALWPLTLWPSDLFSLVIPKTFDTCSVHGSENNLIYTFAS